MNLSEQAWENSANTYYAILNHPFTQEIITGILPESKFYCYLEQEQKFCLDEAKFEATITNKIPDQYIANFLNYAKDAYDYVDYLAQLNFTRTNKLTKTTLAYSNHLLARIADQSVEVQVAALLPCFWYYRELGEDMAAQSVENNEYQKFIDSYTSEEYSQFVDEVISIFDDLANNTTTEIQQQMLDIFATSAKYEFYFIDDIYNNIFF